MTIALQNTIVQLYTQCPAKANSHGDISVQNNLSSYLYYMYVGEGGGGGVGESLKHYMVGRDNLCNGKCFMRHIHVP